MSEKINDKTIFSLLEVTNSIQKTLNERYKSSFWVKAENNKLNLYKQSGHCYPEMVEKRDGKIIAQIKANLWKEDFIRIHNNFQRLLKEPLKDGIKILFKARISFDPSYGLSLLIVDIDPAYTLGDLEREKQETIDQLRQKGFYDQNKCLKFPLLPQRIAIISVETSKGYADFLKVIETNSWHYSFFHLLFPSLLQGDKAVESILIQLKSIQKIKDHFDVVAIIRGGGGDIGLSCYNNYRLAREIALFPIPVITGIGHSTNETVCELVSYSNAITPTKLAEYILQKFHNFSVPIENAEKKVIDKSRRLLSEETARFKSEVKIFRSVTENILSTNRNEVKNQRNSLLKQLQFIYRSQSSHLQSLKVALNRVTATFCNTGNQKIKEFAISIGKDSHAQLNQFGVSIFHFKENMKLQCRQKFKNSFLQLNNQENNLGNLSPLNVLKRGYSITLLNSKSVKSIDEVKSGDTITTIVFEGNIKSIVSSTKKTQE